MAEYGVFPRRGGPGTDLDPWTPTPGSLAILYLNDLACLPSTESLAERPEFTPVLDVTPMIVIASIDRDAMAQGLSEDWVAKANTVYEGYGTHPVSSLEELLEMQRLRNAEGVDLFGTDGPNFPALDALDLSGYPALVERYRSAYYSIFENEEPFDPPTWDAFTTNNAWNTVVMDSMVALLDEPEDSPFFRLERWYHHAMTSLTIPALEAHLA